MFEKFAEDVTRRYQEKMAELFKGAEEEILDLIPQTSEEQTAKALPQKVNAEDLAKQIDFENNFFTKSTCNFTLRMLLLLCQLTHRKE